MLLSVAFKALAYPFCRSSFVKACRLASSPLLKLPAFAFRDFPVIQTLGASDSMVLEDPDLPARGVGGPHFTVQFKVVCHACPVDVVGGVKPSPIRGHRKVSSLLPPILHVLG